MYGYILRAAPQALFIGLLGAVTARVVGLLVDAMLAGPATETDVLISGLNTATDHFVLVGIVALIVTWIGRAVLEARMGRGY